MPVLSRTTLHAQIEFIGINRSGKDLTTETTDEVTVSYLGFEGDTHSSLTRSSCARVTQQYPKGTEIRNTRQVSAVSIEELNDIQATMELDELLPNWVGANLVVSGLHQFTQLPPSSRLIAENGTSLVVDMENAPCRLPGNIIEQHKPGMGTRFPKAAVGKRGVTLWVERVGSLRVGDSLKLHIPPPCNWNTNP